MQEQLFNNDKVTALVIQYKDTGADDPVLLGKILKETEVLVSVIAHKYDTGAVPKDDLIQEANLKLIKNISRYDPERDKKLYSYVSVVVKNAIIDYLRKHRPTTELTEMEDQNDGLSESNYVSLIVEDLRLWFQKRFPTLVKKERAGEILEFVIGNMVEQSNKRKLILAGLSEKFEYNPKQARVLYEAILIKLRILMKKHNRKNEPKEESLQPEFYEVVGEDDYTNASDAFAGISFKFEE